MGILDPGSSLIARLAGHRAADGRIRRHPAGHGDPLWEARPAAWSDDKPTTDRPDRRGRRRPGRGMCRQWWTSCSTPG